jgi:hypothetical protein
VTCARFDVRVGRHEAHAVDGGRHRGIAIGRDRAVERVRRRHGTSSAPASLFPDILVIRSRSQKKVSPSLQISSGAVACWCLKTTPDSMHAYEAYRLHPHVMVSDASSGPCYTQQPAASTGAGDSNRTPPANERTHELAPGETGRRPRRCTVHQLLLDKTCSPYRVTRGA